MSAEADLSAPLPRGLVVGVATSATQVEGATQADGRGASIWDELAQTPGKIVGGDTPELACDHFHRWAEDVALLAELGVDAYRLSISWPRVFATGAEQTPNPAGLDFYDRLVDALLARGVTPWVTLYHWDLPAALQARGGWTSRETVSAFERFAEAVVGRLGDRVKRWCTINEPWCAAVLGHETGQHAPGLTDRAAALAAAHHLLLAHGRAVPIVRALSPGGQVGIAANPVIAYPASNSAIDLAAAERFHAWFNRWFLDPIYGRGYPAQIVAEEVAAGRWPEEGPAWLKPGDLDEMACPTDFLGVNYYSRGILRGPEEGNLPRVLHEVPAEERTDMGWEVYPDGLTDLLTLLHREYAPPALVITECGAAWGDAPGPDGRVRDQRRLNFLASHLRAAGRAIEAGAPLTAFFIWSFLDNFEWNEGFGRRFGLVWVDFSTQQRVIKDSGLWLRERLRARSRGM